MVTLGFWLGSGLLLPVAEVFPQSDPAITSLCSNALVRLVPREYATAVDLHVENLQEAEVTLTLEVKVSNMRSTVKLPLVRTLAGRQKTPLLRLQQIDRTRPWSYQFQYWPTIGDPRVQHDDKVLYRLPFAPGESFRVIQGYDGKFSHHGDNRYALDWRMPVGTPVHAARKGVVVSVKQDSDLGGRERKYEHCANFILIRHPDGTLGNYLHLKKNGARVREGQVVRTGDLIGYSGKTGFSSGPHLHFDVFKAGKKTSRETIPVKFWTEEGKGITLNRGHRYRHPETAEGKP